MNAPTSSPRKGLLLPCRGSFASLGVVLAWAAMAGCSSESAPAAATPTSTLTPPEEDAGTSPPPIRGDAAPFARCAFAADGPLDWSPMDGAPVSLRSFQVVWDAAGFEIRHADGGERLLLATPSTGFLEAAQSALHVEEHQGSFTIDETAEVACSQLSVEEQADRAGVRWYRGRFVDSEPRCDGLGFAVGFCEPRPGHLALEASVTDPAFDRLTLRVGSSSDERIYGLGEQFLRDTLDLKGRRIPVIAQEGGVGRGHEPISTAVNAASAGSAGSETSTYYAAPHYLTSRLQSLFLENHELSVFDFTGAEETRVEVHADRLRARVLFGTSPLELVERFTEYSGRMPPLPAWVHEGAIVALARGTDESLDLLAQLQGQGAAISAVWNQTWSGKAETYIGEQVLWNWAYNPYDKSVYLPAGEWVHLWSGQRYGSESSGTSVTVSAPVGSPSVFYRSGSLVGAELVARLTDDGVLP